MILDVVDKAVEQKFIKNPKSLDHFLQKEMMQLSFKDRNDIQEEIHGVKCLAVKETPQFLETALRQLALEIDERIPDSMKRAYLKSQQPPNGNELQEHERVLRELHQLEPIPQKTYVNDDDFRLMFLRCELFDIPKSARRMLNFLDLVEELFGDYALWRPIRLSDFTKAEMKVMRLGSFQIMPARDRSGRRMSTIFPVHGAWPTILRSKIMLYHSWAVGYKDVETQQKGHIVIIWIDKLLQCSSIRMNYSKWKYRLDASKSTRVCAIHICSPDTPLFRITQSLVVLKLGDENRQKLKVHLGESLEIQYALRGYGIPSEYIPISYTGTVKIKYLVQWIRIRNTIESHDGDVNSLHQYLPPNGIVECPQPNDVLFRKGNSYPSHKGNTHLRGLLASLACLEDEDNNNVEQSSFSSNTKTRKHHPDAMKRPKQMANEIYRIRQELSKTAEDAKRNEIGRYLVWNIEKGWWNEIADKELLCLKLEYMIREFTKTHGKESGTTKSQKCRKSIKNIKLKSGTNVFRSDDGRNYGLCGVGSKAKKRKCDDSSNNNSSSSSDDDDFLQEGRTTQCFGMKFSPCSM